MPDNFARRLAEQFAVDRTQVENRRILGDDLAMPRKVEHFATFATAQDARGAAARLEGLGFTGSVLARGDRNSLCAIRSDAVDEESARRFVREVCGVVAEFEGVYDGWGAPVVLARRPMVQIPDSPADINWD